MSQLIKQPAGAAKRVLITGATGFIGGHLADLLIAEGARVRLLVRDPRRWLGADAELVKGDLDDREALRAAVRGVDHVYHVAGLTKARHVSEYLAVNHGGTVNVLEACRQENGSLERFLLVSSQAAAGPASNGVPVREDDHPQPSSVYGLSKLRSEQAAIGYRALFPVTIVRPPVVYGPRDRDTLMVFKAARWGISPRLGKNLQLSIVHVEDLVRGIRHACVDPRAENQTYFMANLDPVTIPAVTDPISRELGVRSFPLPLPAAPLVLLATLAELGSRLVGRSTPLTRDKVRDALQQRWLCDSSRADRELGWRAEIPLETGVRETARWYRAAGWL